MIDNPLSGNQETSLWAWLLFDAGIKTTQAKQILSILREKALTLAELMHAPKGQLSAIGLDTYYDVLSQSPTPRRYPAAIRWDEPLYPQGLHMLATKHKPALLFTLGDQTLLARHIIYLVPGELSTQAKDFLPDVVDLLLDGSLLPAVFTESPQERILLEQMAFSEGESLIFIDRGFDQWRPSAEILHYIQNERLLTISPMPPFGEANPSLTAIIQEIATAAAERWIYSSLPSARQEVDAVVKPSLLLAPKPSPDITGMPACEMAVDIEDVMSWLHGMTAITPEQQNETELIPLTEETTPLSPEQTMLILQQGGRIPEVLRKRLLSP